MNRLIRAALLSAVLAATPALAQNEPEKEDKTAQKAGEIVTQPARDVGIEKTKIPEVLARAVEQPYAPAGKGCRAVIDQIAELNAVLGPDFDANSKANENKFGNLAAAGGAAIVNSIIPFRGLVREVSGAAGAERRLQAAINGGVARRGYLRGLAVSRGCKLPVPPAPAPAEEEKRKAD
ncbi:hypothetical protein M2336_001064 [Sphingobium sp. B1D7B]|uniref:hypothetical protein n=1 Tax=unclassified Sphingobium TaxID=2611147 RepID=UPI0022255C6D|nr:MULTISPECIES: hypothetical protein [unclassified Sphingobium]MCW2392702.1 hypothetical protein [Sphingobium sp. B11D3A]MCW2404435.1 hypothetical protein [Sphingobium sp. B1D7B]